MATVTIHQAKTNLSKLIARVEAGEEILIARGKQPVAQLTAVERPKKKRGVAGILKGKVDPLPDSFFFDPLPDEELGAWEGDDDKDPL
jgi:prevent-host-death family protein